jgi:hypothetical protein
VPAGFDVRFLMGNDEHSQNVFRRRRVGQDPLAYCDEMERVHGRVGTCTSPRRLHPHHRPASQTGCSAHGAGVLRRGDIYEANTRAGCVSCEAFKQEKDRRRALSRQPDDQAGMDSREELVLPPRATSSRRWSLRGAPVVHRTGGSPQQILRLVEAGLEDISVSRAGQSGVRYRSIRRRSYGGSTR